jgi:UDP-glucose 4-epimerase
MQLDQIITGAAGFVGSHLCQRLGDSSAKLETATLDLLPIDSMRNKWMHREADLRSLDTLSMLSHEWEAPVLVHLAALAEVVMPFEKMSDIASTNIQGTINILDQFNPSRIVFASSSAVYGTVHDRRVRAVPGETAAIGAYGVSKLMGEIICSEWAEKRGASSVALRFGNIVGAGCRGLIPYLVSHAVKYPEADVVAQLRGEGRIIRDYIDVGTAVDSILKAAELPLGASQGAVFNVGSGRGLSNREVAQMVAEVLQAQGCRLKMNFNNPIPAGESESVVLEVSETRSRLGLQPPSTETVASSIEQATLSHLAQMQQQQAREEGT